MNALVRTILRRVIFCLLAGLSSPVLGLECHPEQGCLEHPANQGQRPALVFIHGSPGRAAHFARYLEDPALADRWDVYALDRPGFGRSPMPFTSDLRAQAQQLLKQLPTSQPLTLAGHSLGGPVALWMAILAPEQVRRVVLLAASLAPEYEHPRWFNHMAASAPIRWVLPRSWRRSNREVMALSTQLQALLQHTPQLHAHLTIVQGAQDRLVNPASPAVLLDHLPTTLPREHLVWDHSGHLLPWRDYVRTRDLLLTIPPETS